MWPFSKRAAVDLFSKVPGPSPWYLESGGLSIPEHKWIAKGLPHVDCGKIYLCKNKDVYLIVGFGHYVLPISETLVIIWNQAPQNKGLVSSPLKMMVLDIKKLEPIKENLDKVCAQMDSNNIGLMFQGTPIAKVELDTVIIDEPISLTFPEPISEIDELLIFCHSSGIGPSNGWDKQNLALMLIRPSKSLYQLYPQDWFNNGSYDFGYQWPTRVARNPKTGNIHGEGIRIAPFILDKSFKNIR